MNKTECINGEIGDLLHAYELDILPPDETEKFEIHLLECEYCAQKVADFRRQAGLLRSGQQVRDEIAGQASDAHATGEAVTIWSRLWPKGNFLLKPGLLLLIVLILLIPAYRGLFVGNGSRIGPPQVINLVPFRDSGTECFDRSLGGDGLISFVYPEAVTGQPYVVMIKSESGGIVFADSTYTDFDEYGTGRLLIPAMLMTPGRYKLLISSEGESGPDREYAFCVRE